MAWMSQASNVQLASKSEEERKRLSALDREAKERERRRNEDEMTREKIDREKRERKKRKEKEGLIEFRFDVLALSPATCAH